MDREYLANSPFLHVLGDESRLRVLDVLLTRRSLRVTVERLAELASVSEAEVRASLPVLEAANLSVRHSGGEVSLAGTFEAMALAEWHIDNYSHAEEIRSAMSSE
jgi:DeoR/GlpR family transcriptional regulator of sugar metabolism